MIELLLPSWLAGMLIALVSGPLGALVVWRKMSYFGDALSHAALLGVAIGFLFDVTPLYTVLAIIILFAFSLTSLQSRNQLPNDALLGILAHSTLSLGLVLISLMTDVRIDVMSYLFGDLLSIGYHDVMIILCGVITILAILAWQWRNFLFITINEDLAFVDGICIKKTQLILTLLLATTIGISMKFIGALIITSLLVIPAATAKYYANTPEKMVLIAILINMMAVCMGLVLSIHYDTPTGPSVVVSASLFFLTTVLAQKLKGMG